MKEESLWEKFAPEYIHRVTDAETTDLNVRVILPELLKHIPANLHGKRVLDVACGNGLLTFLLANSGAEVFGIDFTETFISDANKYIPQNPTFIHADAQEKIFHIDGQFDFVCSNMALQDVKNVADSLAHISAATKDTGSFIFSIRHPVGDGWQGNYEDEGVIYNPLPANLQQTLGIATYPPRYHRPINKYVDLLSENGFSITAQEEIYTPDSQNPLALIISASKY